MMNDGMLTKYSMIIVHYCCIYCLLDLEMSQIVNIVIPQVQSDWVDIAYSLKFKIEDVKVIKENHREDTKKCCRQLFEDWLRTDCGITPKTWSTLLHCLKNLHLSKAADEIEKELGLISAAKKSKNQVLMNF